MLIANVEIPNRKHYVAIKSLLRLLSKQNNKHKEAQTLLYKLSKWF